MDYPSTLSPRSQLSSSDHLPPASSLFQRSNLDSSSSLYDRPSMSSYGGPDPLSMYDSPGIRDPYQSSLSPRPLGNTSSGSGMGPGGGIGGNDAPYQPRPLRPPPSNLPSDYGSSYGSSLPPGLSSLDQSYLPKRPMPEMRASDIHEAELRSERLRQELARGPPLPTLDPLRRSALDTPASPYGAGVPPPPPHGGGGGPPAQTSLAQKLGAKPQGAQLPNLLGMDENEAAEGNLSSLIASLGSPKTLEDSIHDLSSSFQEGGDMMGTVSMGKKLGTVFSMEGAASLAAALGATLGGTNITTGSTMVMPPEKPNTTKSKPPPGGGYSGQSMHAHHATATIDLAETKPPKFAPMGLRDDDPLNRYPARQLQHLSRPVGGTPVGGGGGGYGDYQTSLSGPPERYDRQDLYSPTSAPASSRPSQFDTPRRYDYGLGGGSSGRDRDIDEFVIKPSPSALKATQGGYGPSSSLGGPGGASYYSPRYDNSRAGLSPRTSDILGSAAVSPLYSPHSY